MLCMLDEQGRMVIPAELRDRYQFTPGTIVQFELVGNTLSITRAADQQYGAPLPETKK